MDANAARVGFSQVIEAPDHEIDLAHACLWISAEANPGLDVALYRERLNELAAAPRLSGTGEATVEQRVGHINAHLFEQERFRGNREHYFDPRNSYLDCVIDRRTGIPITLAIVWMAVAERAGLDCHGVGFPGHFLVGVEGSPRIFVDAFSGECLDADACEARLRSMYGQRVPFQEALLRPASRREILARVLRNLKQIHLQQEEFGAAIACCDRILLLDPGVHLELRDRGLLHRSLECWNAARDDLERYLALVPDAPEREDVELVVDELRARTAHLH